MIVSPDILRKEMVQLLTMIDKQISEVEAEAVNHGIKPEEVRDAQGGWPMSPLLLAKVQAVAALVELNKR